MNRLIPLSILTLSLGACITMQSVATTRASNDLRCPEEQVALANIGGTSFRASGCGQEATYNCVAGGNGYVCVREEQHPVHTQLTSGVAR